MLTVEKEFVEFKKFEVVTVARCLASSVAKAMADKCEAVANRGTS